MQRWSICAALLSSLVPLAVVPLAVVPVAVVPVAEAQVAETGALLCSNGADDDGDGLFDAADPDCERSEVPPPPGTSPQDATPETTQAQATGWPERPQPRQQEEREYIWDPAELDVLTRPEVDPLYPQRRALQPLTYARGMLVPSLGLHVVNGPSAMGLGSTVGFETGLGATYGIFDFWEVSLFPLSLRFAPGPVTFLNPAIASTLRFFETSVFEMGFRTILNIPVQGVTSWQLSVPLLFHLGTIGRIDFTPIAIDLLFADGLMGGIDVLVTLASNVRLAFQITEYAFLGASSGVVLFPNDYDTGVFPLGFFAGATIPGFDEGPLMQLELSFTFPSFGRFMPGGSDVLADLFVVSLDARVFLYLLGGES